MWDKILRIFGKGAVSETLANKNILVVDDGEAERTLMTRVLSSQGCRVVAASNGKAGLEKALAEKFDLVILDYIMPGLNGKEVCQRLKADAKTRSIPVIFLTGSVSPGNVVECYDVGADYYLSKPITTKALIKQLELTFQELSA